MEIKVGQWFRFDNYIEEIIDIEVLEKTWANEKEIWLENKDGEQYEYLGCKVADNPRELIQEGDLVEYQQILMEVTSVRKGKIRVMGFSKSREVMSLSYISKILTPNLNNGFDLQWEVNNE